ncbi:MAG: hypothetical protein JJE39_04980 [Vicinamibacteria bacterium]|nr:hypothetical protein [Vicinamibacteria bacterium]
MAKVDEASGPRGRRVCCLVSEMLEEMGLDSKKAREIRRQTLLGLMTFCQWQLARIEEETEPEDPKREEPKRKPRGRRVNVV